MIVGLKLNRNIVHTSYQGYEYTHLLCVSCDQDEFVQECKVTCKNVTCNAIVAYKTFDCGFYLTTTTYSCIK